MPAGYVATTATSSTNDITADQTVDFGIALISSGGTSCSAKIIGSVFNDSNANGLLDIGEAGLSNWKINLASSSGAPITTVTDSSGKYAFSNLCKDTYTVSQTIAPPWVTTTTLSYVVKVIDDTGNVYSGNDFGNNQIFSISGSVFNDVNKNQVKDAGETGMAGATIFLSGATFASAKTDASGNYTIPKLPSGDYRILLVMPNGYSSTTANSLNFTLGSAKSVNFGLVLTSTLKVGGVCNNNSLDVVVVFDHSNSMTQADPATGNAKMAEAHTAADQFIDIISRNVPTARIGAIQFSNANNYPNGANATSIVSPLTTDYTQLKNLVNSITAVADNSADDGTCFECAFDMVNKMLSSESSPTRQKIVVFMTDGIANNVIADGAFGRSAASVADNVAMDQAVNGVNSQNIIFNTIGVGSGAGNIDGEFLTQIASTNGGIYYNDPTNGNLQNIYTTIANQSAAAGSVQGTVYNDANANKKFDAGEKTVPNMQIQLTGNALPKMLPTVSDSNGNYAFYGVCDGNYTVTEIPMAPWLLTTPGSLAISIAGGGASINNNFGNKFGYQVTGSVFNDINKNRKKDATESTINGAVIAASNGTVTSNPDGTFTVAGLLPGPVTVSCASPIPPGFLMIYPKTALRLHI